jgi:hypothetical protein
MESAWLGVEPGNRNISYMRHYTAGNIGNIGKTEIEISGCYE